MLLSATLRRYLKPEYVNVGASTDKEIGESESPARQSPPSSLEESDMSLSHKHTPPTPQPQESRKKNVIHRMKSFDDL